MESTNKKNKGNKELSIVDLLCSAGYLPPRNERDLERFERIYSEKRFEIEAHFVNSDAIFEKVTGEEKSKTKRIRPLTTIYDCPGALRVAESTTSSFDDSAANALSQLIENKKD